MSEIRRGYCLYRNECGIPEIQECEVEQLGDGVYGRRLAPRQYDLYIWGETYFHRLLPALIKLKSLLEEARADYTTSVITVNGELALVQKQIAELKKQVAEVGEQHA
jgi:hypothetical protein